MINRSPDNVKRGPPTKLADSPDNVGGSFDNVSRYFRQCLTLVLMGGEGGAEAFANIFGSIRYKQHLFHGIKNQCQVRGLLSVKSYHGWHCPFKVGSKYGSVFFLKLWMDTNPHSRKNYLSFTLKCSKIIFSNKLGIWQSSFEKFKK